MARRCILLEGGWVFFAATRHPRAGPAPSGREPSFGVSAGNVCPQRCSLCLDNIYPDGYKRLCRRRWLGLAATPGDTKTTLLRSRRKQRGAVALFVIHVYYLNFKTAQIHWF